MPLDELYVPPQFVANAPRHLAKLGKLSEEQSVFDLDHITRRLHRIVVVGNPGAGKSTLTIKLANVSSQANFEGPRPDWVPLHITLRNFDQERIDVPGLSISQYISGWIRKELGGLTLSAEQVELLCETGRAFVIFDGLDELTAASRRRDMSLLIGSFSDLYPETSILVTCRTVGYEEATLPTDIFTKVELADFSEESVFQYANNWFRLSPRLNGAEKSWLPRRFMEQSRDVPDLRKNPLMLGLMCRVFHETRNIPQNRTELYADCALLLFRGGTNTGE